MRRFAAGPSLGRRLTRQERVVDGHHGDRGQDVKRDYNRNQVAGRGHVEKITGVLLSPEELDDLAVCDLAKNSGDKSCLEDPAMGARQHGETCPTCNNVYGRCMGHFGKITIPEHAWFAHPFFVKDGVIQALMNLFCYDCFESAMKRLNIQQMTTIEEDLPEVTFLFSLHEIENLNRQNLNLERIERLKALSEKAEKLKCDGPCPAGMFKGKPDFSIVQVIKKTEKEVDIKTVRYYLMSISRFLREHIVAGIPLYEFIGFSDISWEDLIITLIPVIPTCDRPAIIINNQKKESNITTLYWSMLRLINQMNDTSNETILNDLRKQLREKFYQYINNKAGGAAGRGGDPLKTLTHILDGKRGLVKGQTLSGRTNNSGRTVITGDTAIGPHEVRIPKFMAEKFLIPVDVTVINVDQSNELIRKGIARLLVQNPKGAVKRVITLDDEEKRRTYRAEIGDRLYRILINGDIVVINRQPTLHRWSILAHRARIIDTPPGAAEINTIGLNTIYVSGYNADFDGDEVHIHVPSSIDARAEAAALMAVENVPISYQTSTNIFALIQNTVWGAYEMTKKIKEFSREKWQQLALQPNEYIVDYKPFERIKYIQKTAPKIFRKHDVNLGLYNAYTLLSMAFPPNFSYKKIMDKDETVLIEDGILVCGVLTKPVVGAGANSIIQVMYESHGPRAIVTFGHVMQSIVQKWMEGYGLTMSITDFAPNRELEDKIENIKDDHLRKAKEIGQRNVSGVFNIDSFTDLLKEIIVNPDDDIIPEQKIGELIGEIVFRLFNAIQIQRNRFMKGLSTTLYTEEKVLDVLSRAISAIEPFKDNENFTNLIFESVKQPVLEFIRIELTNPLQAKEVTVKSVYEKAEIEADSLDALEYLGKQIPIDLILSKEQKAMGGGLVSNIASGSRGKEFNIIQTKFGLGQQTKSGQLLEEAISGGTRVLPFFLEHDPDPAARGFIRNSYFRGLTPTEYFMASIPTRQAQTDTSLGTGKTGYMQRRLQASMGDYIVMQDGTVRNEKGEIVSYLYGGIGLDASQMVKKQGKFVFVNVDQLVRQVNSEFNTKIKANHQWLEKF